LEDASPPSLPRPRRRWWGGRRIAAAEGAPSPSAAAANTSPHFSCSATVPTRTVYKRPLSSRAATCPTASTTLPVTGRRALGVVSPRLILRAARDDVSVYVHTCTRAYMRKRRPVVPYNRDRTRLSVHAPAKVSLEGSPTKWDAARRRRAGPLSESTSSS